MTTLRSRSVWAGVVVLVMSFGGRLAAQPPPGRALSKSGVPLRGEELFALDLSNTPVGEIPVALKLISGNVEVVQRGGARMLKAPTASAFLITLPQVLPPEFTLEFDLIPKVGGPPPDLSVEGTPAINQGPGSAHLLWQADGYLAVIGGAQDNYEQPMPEDLRATMSGVLTHVGMSFEGNTVRLYTNGQRLYTLERQFARSRVLRVSLGGIDGGVGAVYLAGLRIATGAPVIAAAPPPAPPPPAPPAPPPAPTPAPNAPSPGPVSGPASLTATARSGWGVTLRWNEVPNASGYQLERSVLGQAFSPLTLQGDAATLVANGHDDVSVLPGRTYQYRVRASFAGGASSEYGPAAQYAAPAQAPQIQNLTATVGTTALPAEDQSGKTYRGVTYSWNRVEGAPSYEYGIEGWSVNPSTGVEQQTFRLRNTVSAMASPPLVTRFEAGTRGLFCVSVIREFDPGSPLPGATCVSTAIPPPSGARAPIVSEGPVREVSGTSSAIPGTPTGAPQKLGTGPVGPGTVGETAQQKSGLTETGTATLPAVAGITARVGAPGDVAVSWAAAQDPSSYFIVRWKVDDAACCTNFSPPAGIPGLTWQDDVLPRSGTYAYRVYATSSAGIAVGETRVTYQRIANVSEPPAEPTPAPTPPPPTAGPVTKQTVTKDPHPSPAGVMALFAPEQFGYGVMVMWSPIPSATAFRVYRMASATEPGQLLATVSKADADKLSSMGGAVQGAFDPMAVEVVGGGGKYWVEAVFADGVSSPPSLITEIQARLSNPFAAMLTPPENLTATVSGTSTLTLVSNRTSMNGQQARASNVTWNWDVPPGTAGTRAIFYFVTAQLVTPGVFGSATTLYHSETIRMSPPPPYAVMLTGGVLGPPFKLPVPAGMGVRFCVAYAPLEKSVVAGNYGSSTILSPSQMACVDNVIPP